MATPNKQSRISDTRVDFAPAPTWQKEGARQPLLGSDYVIFEPHQKAERQPQQLDFDVHSSQCFLMGPMSKFQIRGGFEMKKKDEQVWNPCPKEEYANVCLAPNW